MGIYVGKVIRHGLSPWGRELRVDGGASGLDRATIRSHTAPPSIPPLSKTPRDTARTGYVPVQGTRSGRRIRSEVEEGSCEHVAQFGTIPRAFFEQARAGHPSIGEAVLTGERVSHFQGTKGLSGFLRSAWGPGWALVGDAGYTKDPISAHGISDALRDAELCARAIDRSLRDPAGERGYLSGYQVARDRLSLSMLEKSARLGSCLWDESEASVLMRGINQAVKEECEAMVALPAWEGVSGPAVLAG
ncbi:MAG: NAD(P)/FAD-dependent oxidoreductase [Acidimicrobiia bacterium]